MPDDDTTQVTSIRVPTSLLREVDRIARERGTSRARIFVEAAERLVREGRGEWPLDFARGLLPVHGDPEAFTQRIIAARTSRLPSRRRR